jgi:hypothetical protein
MSNGNQISEDIIFLKCPHCGVFVAIYKKEINCKIFRHGVFKSNFKQINPHETKENCDKYVEEDLIFGCGKPFKIFNIIEHTDSNEKKENYYLENCGYI